MAIDHEKRRHDIATLTIDMVAREGIEAATIRRIAMEAGFSTTAITHYFADKQELLEWAFHILAKEGERRFEEAREEEPDDIVAALMTLVPWCPVNIRRWKAYLSFWDQAARDPELATMLARGTQVGFEFLRQLLRARAGKKRDIETAAEMLNAMIQGLALQMLVDPTTWNEAKARTTLLDMFELAILKVEQRGH
ncbi:TetR/AcrR family transcriptional regulator [Novosphingobium sp. JCM 18896]|uniref:TetR/AcrR family transcriptional regulator n=1 Tax=Novosphingobium sp. JCM 18896 TaxID=2989731 RepID=UPI002222FDB8|nr:TetR family transcriptional regulator C-terminal domain-containing protein [Novosphingobium sp. JCM 18896]MCW1431726.1 TetR family transcriptional regulator C-terminal domain-containing protein [Novosphingobium sp. JCM 18896]